MFQLQRGLLLLSVAEANWIPLRIQVAAVTFRPGRGELRRGPRFPLQT